MTLRERFLQAMRGEGQLWIGDPWSCFCCPTFCRPMLPDAISEMIGRCPPGGEAFLDAWGVAWDFPAGQPAPIPHITEDCKALKDITNWREEVRFPPLDGIDWSGAKEQWKAAACDEKLTMAVSGRGLFEFSHMMMGMEEAMVNYLLEPESMYGLLDRYTDWKIEAAKKIINELDPDFLMNHDDWGSKRQLFLPPGVWREIIKPLYKRYYDYVKSRGVFIMHHCDCYAEDLAVDMVDIGIDVWQGATPENDINAVIEKTQGKLLVIGGIDMSVIEHPGASASDIRAHIRQVIDAYAKNGHFLPCFSSISPINETVAQISADEMDGYGAIFTRKNKTRRR